MLRHRRPFGSPSNPSTKPRCLHCRWRPEQIEMMGACNARLLADRWISRFTKSKGKHSEVVVDASHYRRSLPHSVVAFVVPAGAGDACDDEVGNERRYCTRWTYAAHASFLRGFNLSAQQVPLLSLDVSDRERPFRSSTDAAG